MTASKWRWSWNVPGLWEIVETYSLQLKVSEIFEKMQNLLKTLMMGGFIFHQIWRLKTSKSTDLKNFLRYFLWPFLNQISEITSCHLFSSQLLVLSLAFYLKEYLFLPTYLFYFISSKINRFKSRSIHTAIDWFMYDKK